jgi:hypothetical protein
MGKVPTHMAFHVTFPPAVHSVVHILPLKQDEEIISEILSGYKHYQYKCTFSVTTVYHIPRRTVSQLKKRSF